MIVKNNLIAISGGPGSGKTTLLKLLALHGYHTVAESGRQIIQQRIATNLPPRPAPDKFALEMFDTDFKNYDRQQQDDRLVFFDRTFLDSGALLHEADPAAYEGIKPVIETYRFNPIVFFAPPWEAIYANDDERDQSFEEAQQTYDLLLDWYKEHDYTVYDLPKAPAEERMIFMIDIIKENLPANDGNSLTGSA